MINLLLENKYSALGNKYNYLLENFHSIYQVPNNYNLHFGNSNKECDIKITPGKDIVNFFTDKQTLIPKKYIFINWNDQKLPILFYTKNYKKQLFTCTDDNVIINYDILSSAFYFLSCWQEWMSDKTDEIGRFPAKENFLLDHGLFQVPVVNFYFEILKKSIELFNDQSKVQLKNSKMTSYITHDIDQCKSGWIENSGRAFLDGHPIKAGKTILKKLIDKDIWFNFNKMQNIEEEYNFKATYFFLPSMKKYGDIKNADYNIYSSRMKKVISSIIKNGHEVGLHSSYNSGFQNGILSKEVNDFPVKINGNRFHYLAMRIPESFNLIDKTKLSYDTTLGFAEHIGFRSGYCYPYHPYNIDKDKKYSFLEFPLMVMDRTLEHSSYMNLTPKVALETIKNMIKVINKFKGSFILLWHNKFISGYKFSNWLKVYKGILSYLEEVNCRFSTPKDFLKRDLV